ncbi:MAG: threonylcarbamoyl-AMP synthase [Acidobacteriota bacterium]|nr:threonylcarbamoyl-AMP synthase [Acidobacteriota bacterium]
MLTERLVLDPTRLDDFSARSAVDRAAEILRSGGLVALPTETVYGLGANALDAAAVARIFEAKRRPAWDPIIVHIAGSANADNPMLRRLVAEIPEAARKLMEAFWPGPLTLLLPRSPSVPDAVTAGRPLVGIRMPAHPVAYALIEKARIPVAAPSANLFSHISPTTAQHVLDDLDGRIDAILEAGPTEHGVESTVLDPCQSPMVIYRPGAVTLEQIQAVAGDVKVFTEPSHVNKEPEALPSPGVGIRHYAPHARLVLVEGPQEEMPRLLETAATKHTNERIGLMRVDEFAMENSPKFAAVFPWGHWSNPEELAHRLYAGLRALDAAGCTVILCPMPATDGIGAALRDRLAKAARV